MHNDDEHDDCYREQDEFDDHFSDLLTEVNMLAHGLLLEDAMLQDLLRDDDDDAQPEIHLDVPFVPSDERIVEAMLDLAEVTSRDMVYDLGCGDGRIVIAAAMRRNARGIGVDLDPSRIADAMEYAANSRVEHMVDFIEADLMEVDFSDATVVNLYLLDSFNLELRPRLQQELRPGTRVISHAFGMGDWKADEQVRCNGTTLYKWVVPARLEGEWEWQDGSGQHYRIALTQKHQQLKAKAWVNAVAAHECKAQVHGDLFEVQLRPTAGDQLQSFVMRYQEGRLEATNKTLQPQAAVRLPAPAKDTKTGKAASPGSAA